MAARKRPTSSPRVRPGIHISAALQSRILRAKDGPSYDPFKPYVHDQALHPPGVTMAMDDAYNSFSPTAGWSVRSLGSAIAEGQVFLGYPTLAALLQRVEYMNAVMSYADDMTRKWIEFKASAGTDKQERIDAITDKWDALQVQARMKDHIAQALGFGRAHVYLDTGDTDNPDELKKDIGDGARSAATAFKLPGKKVLGLRTIEPVWVSPHDYETSNPLKPNWYKPNAWHVMAREVHASRLLTTIPFPVSDLLKPAYSFGGIPLIQMGKPYVDNWLNVRQSTTDIAEAYSIFVLATKLQDTMAGGNGDQEVLNRVALFNRYRSNKGTMVIDKETEDFKNISANVSGIEAIQAASQEHMSAAWRIPLVKLTGISPSGLNASSEGEIRVYYDLIRSMQEGLIRPLLQIVLDFTSIELFGDVDPDITFDFVKLFEVTEVEAAQIRSADAQTGTALIQSGVISTEEERARVSNDPDSPYIDLKDTPIPVMPGPAPGEEGYVGDPDNWQTALEGINKLGGLLPAPEPEQRASPGAWEGVLKGVLANGGLENPDNDGIVASPEAWKAVGAGLSASGGLSTPDGSEAVQQPLEPAIRQVFGKDALEDEPRKGAGQAGGGEWTAQSGGGAQKSAPGKNGIIAGNNPAKRPHVAHYDPKATQVDAQGVVHTTSVVDAARALYDGKKVDLNQPREVATLVDHLGQVAKHMIAMGDAAPNFNLCNVSVDNTNIFCAVSEGIPRIDMPQLPPNLHPFLSFLGEKGLGFQPAMEKAGYLRATQNELIGAKVAAIAKALQNIDPRKLDPLVVSKDNYIVDGHHRWSAEVAISAEQGNFDRPLEIYRVNSDILPLLKLANDFTGGKGHVAGSLKPGEAALNLKTENHFLDGETHAHDGRPFGLDEARPNQAMDDFSPSEPRKGVGQAGAGEWTAEGGAAAPFGKGKQSEPSAASLSDKIVSTRNVTAKSTKGEAEGKYLRIDTDAMKADPELFKHNVGLFKRGDLYPGMKPDELKGSEQEVAKAVIERMRDNLDFLVGMVPKDKIKAWAHWYEGAHKFAEDFGKKYGVDTASAAGVIAALSPQRPWDENVYFADRVMDIMKNHPHDKWDDAMKSTGERIWTSAKNAPILKAIEGKRLDELDDPVAQAAWIRTWNEAHEDRKFEIAKPDGTFGGKMKTAAGGYDTASWGSLAQTVNAIHAFQSGGDPKKLSAILGERHKVRSFYNNIIAPDDPNGDVTVDTHAVGAAWLQPTSGTSASVWHNLANNPGAEGKDPFRPKNWVAAKGSAKLGVRGTYPLYADAYREAAKDLGLKPREVQSVAWEMKQRLFSDKLTGERVQKAVNEVWEDYRDGKLSLKDAREKVVSVATAMRPDHKIDFN